jgi:hypothetical protein
MKSSLRLTILRQARLGGPALERVARNLESLPCASISSIISSICRIRTFAQGKRANADMTPKKLHGPGGTLCHATTFTHAQWQRKDRKGEALA